jgi:hypothetical protein
MARRIARGLAVPVEISLFFDSYRDAFNRLDGHAVSAHYDLPAMIVDARGNGVFADAAALEANNIALCRHYAGRALPATNLPRFL